MRERVALEPIGPLSFGGMEGYLAKSQAQPDLAAELWRVSYALAFVPLREEP